MKQTLTLSLTFDVATVLNYSGPSALPGAVVSQPYSFDLGALVTGGTGPRTFAATGLPAGLTLSAAGVLGGTPTQSGPFSPVVTVTDSGV